MIIEGLNKIARIGGLEFGCAIGSVSSVHADLIKRQCGVVTPNNDLKIGVIRPNSTTVNYAPGDAAVSWANTNGLRVRGHNLVWNASVPAWITSLSAIERQGLMLKHIEETMGHFSTVHEWDVVNEPIEAANKLPGDLRGGPWYDAWGGEGYIIQAFKRARSVSSSCRLVLNEQGLERPTTTSYQARRSFISLVDRMLDAGLDFDVGIEGHIESQAGVSLEGMAWLARELEDRRLGFRITELDNWDYWFFNQMKMDMDWQDRAVSDQVRDLLFPLVMSPCCRGVVTWGLVDTDSAWLNNSALSRPLPFDKGEQPKDMAFAIRDAFMLHNALFNKEEAVKSYRYVGED